MHTVYTLWVFALSFKLLCEVNGPEKADDSKIITVELCVAFGCTNRSVSVVLFHENPCDKERQQLWLIALTFAKPLNRKHALVCCDHILEEDSDPNYKMQWREALISS